VLEITSAPPGADVFVDDEPRGRTDPETGRLRLTALGAGRHRVRLSAPGHDDLLQDVDLAGESLAFHGVMSARQSPAALPVPAASTEPRSALPRSLALGLGLIVAILLALWFRSQTLRSKPSERVQTPPSRADVIDGDTDEGLPTQFGAYRLLRRIGKGGMASVYEAEWRGDRFALKRPLAGFLDDRTFLERFQRESELGRALHHPNIVRIFDRGQVGLVPYFAMELISGETLQARLERDGRLDASLATAITAQVAEALDYAHHKGVIHRDLKPSNIMLERSGGVKVMDYGIARSTHLEGVTITGSFVGTPHYAAPETVEMKTDPRSDLYSLGIVFFEMLTGGLPFRGDNVLAVLHHHCVTPPPAPSSINYTVSKELDRIVLRLLSKQPSDRPTAEELLNELADCLRRADEAR
jgi:serine/threonine protein kinase